MFSLELYHRIEEFDERENSLTMLSNETIVVDQCLFERFAVNLKATLTFADC